MIRGGWNKAGEKLFLLMHSGDLLLKNFWETRKGKLLEHASLALIFFFVLTTNAYATELETFLEKVAKIIKYGALVVGWGLGFFLIVAGVQDLVKSSDDPRAGGKGAKKCFGGVVLIGVATLISWTMGHFGLQSNVDLTPPSP